MLHEVKQAMKPPLCANGARNSIRTEKSAETVHNQRKRDVTRTVTHAVKYVVCFELFPSTLVHGVTYFSSAS
jgi:hypothetical protein